jgi:quercetin dioxygenase-like cupin family protein
MGAIEGGAMSATASPVRRNDHRHTTPAGVAWPGRCAPPRLVPAATLLLSSLTALILLALALTLGGPLVRDGPSAPRPATGQATLVRAFYGAVNTILAGGDGAPLATTVAPDVVVHLPDRQLVGQPALLAYWTAVGGAVPGLQLELDTLIVDGDQVATTLDPLAPTSAWSRDILGGPTAPASAAERFRVVHGRIADYWSDLTTDALPRALPPLPLTLWPGPKQADLARFTFPPGATLADLVAADPHLLLPETGTLTVTLVGQAQLLRGDAVRAGWQVTGSQPLTLHPGDALLVPSGVTHAIHNATSTGASLLGVLLSAPDELAALQRQPTADRSNQVRLLGMYAERAVGVVTTWPGGGTWEVLAEGGDRCTVDHATLTVADLTLGPGQRLAAHPVAGVEVAAIASGAALLGVAPPDRATTLAQSASADPAPAPAATPALAGSRVVLASDGLAVATGTSPPLANAGPASVRLTLIAVDCVPATSASASPSRSDARAAAP